MTDPTLIASAIRDAVAPLLSELQAIHETIRLALTEPEGPELATGECPHPITVWSSDGSAKVCGECKAVIP